MKIIFSIFACLLLAACATQPTAPLPPTHPASPFGQESLPAPSYTLAPDAATQATGSLLNQESTPSHE